MRAFLMSGSLAGLAGAIEVTGVTYSLYENLSPGYGYTAIAVALVGSLQSGAHRAERRIVRSARGWRVRHAARCRAFLPCSRPSSRPRSSCS